MDQQQQGFSAALELELKNIDRQIGQLHEYRESINQTLKLHQAQGITPLRTAPYEPKPVVRSITAARPKAAAPRRTVKAKTWMSPTVRKRISESMKARHAGRKQAKSVTPAESAAEKPESPLVTGPTPEGNGNQMSTLDMICTVVRNNGGRTMSTDEIDQAFHTTFGMDPAKTWKEMISKRAAHGKTFYRDDEGKYGLIELRTTVQPVNLPATAIAS